VEIQKEQVQWAFRGPQASSYEDANIVVTKTSPVYLTTSLELYVSFILLYDSYLCIRL
jgi:hypothetical protein